MANEVLPGIGRLLVTFAILNSSLANANAGANASTRAIFALGRARLLPAAFAGVHPTYRTPVNAVHLQGILGIVLAVGLGLLFKDVTTGGPLTTYIFIGYSLGLLFAGMYIAVNIAAIGYYLGEGRAEFNVHQARCDPDHRGDPADPGIPRRPGRLDDPDPEHPARRRWRRPTTWCRRWSPSG